MILLTSELALHTMTVIAGGAAVISDNVFNAGVALPSAVVGGLASLMFRMINHGRQVPRQRRARVALLLSEATATAVLCAFLFGIITF
jgi:hypothetical protein